MYVQHIHCKGHGVQGVLHVPIDMNCRQQGKATNASLHILPEKKNRHKKGTKNGISLAKKGEMPTEHLEILFKNG